VNLRLWQQVRETIFAALCGGDFAEGSVADSGKCFPHMLPEPQVHGEQECSPAAPVRSD